MTEINNPIFFIPFNFRSKEFNKDDLFISFTFVSINKRHQIAEKERETSTISKIIFHPEYGFEKTAPYLDCVTRKSYDP